MDIKKLREEFSTLKTESTTFLALPDTEKVTQEQLDANQTRLDRMKFIQTQLDQHAKFAQMKLDNPSDPAAPGTVQLPTDPAGRDEFNGISVADETPEQAALRFSKQRNAINNFIRTGDAKGVKFVSAALTTGSGTGAMLPTTVAPPVAIKRQMNPLRAVLEARGLKVISTDTTENISVPVFDDTANVADAIAQNATGDNEKEPTVTGLTLGNQLYDSGTCWSSNTLLNSLSFDLLGFIQPQLDLRLDRKQSAAWMTNVRTNATVGVTTASTAGITYAEILALQHSIAVVNRPYGAFILSDGLFRTLRGLLDSQGRPLYQESLRDDAPDKLLGWPVFITEDLPDPAAGVVSAVAVAANLIFIRDINNRRIARYVNQPNWPDQFGLRMFSNGDFQYVPSAVRALKHAAA